VILTSCLITAAAHRHCCPRPHPVASRWDSLDSRTSQLDFLDEDAPVVTLAQFFEELYGALEGPIHPCSQCDAAFDHHARVHADRLDAIAQYSPERVHPGLFASDWAPASFDPQFWAALHPADTAAQAQRLDDLLREEAPGVYSFPMLSPRFCEMLLDELDHFAVIAEERGLAVQRPNSMNKYGVIVNQMGLEQVYIDLALVSDRDVAFDQRRACMALNIGRALQCRCRGLRGSIYLIYA